MLAGCKRFTELVKVFPSLQNSKSKKGDNGCIGVIGGSFEYTGAPFYAAISALKAGCDLSHIFCSKSAAIPIKSYSPQIIVHPVFTASNELENELTCEEIQKMHAKWLSYFEKHFQKINSWVIGPGLGRDRYLLEFFPKLIKKFPKGTNLVLDADGLFMLCQHPQLIESHLKELNCILTPNHVEFKHLNKIFKMEIKEEKSEFMYDRVVEENFESQLPVTVVRKGEVDEIYTSSGKKIKIFTNGSRKRCGGIGDILAGCMATCSYWDYENGPTLACYLVKKAAFNAFEAEGRALTAPKIIEALTEVIKSYP